MQNQTPFVREAGNGPVIVCLHANASTSGQWRPLMERLSPTHRVVTPDLYGAGQSPDWPSRSVITLNDEVDLIEPLITEHDAPLTLVGHSYGGAVALKAALRHRERVSALVLYEPTLFSVVDALNPQPNPVDEILEVVARSTERLKAGDAEGAAEIFIDYWMPGAWAFTPEKRRAPIAESVRNIERWGYALSKEPTRVGDFAALEMPVLCLIGQHTRNSARAVTSVLTQVLPNVEVVEIPGVGHMGPVTHPEVVNTLIEEFLERIEAGNGEMAA